MPRSTSMRRGKDAAQEKHDVFISFRGEDTRKTFTSHLHAALTRIGIRTYIDYNLEGGDDISATLVKAIEDAKLSLIVFSKNYPNSKWCLDELVKILECRKKKGQLIVPVFYDVDPSSVRKQMGSYVEAFAIHEQNFKGNMEKVQSWREALTEASSFAGWDCTINRTEYEMVEEIARNVLEKADGVYVGDLDLQIEKLEKLAELQEEFSQEIYSS
ncbi:disease resistance protein RPV1-like [Prosopis cineraria]|uniref:disease resistance protein RPV1-like n=1 Tax=Prosopis cineraria TaxID=364024 RepID=UPI00240F90CF|nr:disease resistance protein RPV1-like [Prosopis cineraria]